jgi:hypothetical protein
MKKMKKSAKQEPVKELTFDLNEEWDF